MFFKATCYSNLQDIITPLNIRFCTALIFNFFVNVNSCFIIRTEVGISHGRNSKCHEELFDVLLNLIGIRLLNYF